MPQITVFRGFKLPVSTIDAFRLAKGQDETFGHPPVPQQDAEISALLKAAMHKDDDKSEADARLIIPQREAYSLSDTAYVAYTWVNVFVQRRLQMEELSEQAPAAFERLRADVLSYNDDQAKASSANCGYGNIALFIVYTENRNWTPEELRQRVQVSSQSSDQALS